MRACLAFHRSLGTMEAELVGLGYNGVAMVKAVTLTRRALYSSALNWRMAFRLGEITRHEYDEATVEIKEARLSLARLLRRWRSALRQYHVNNQERPQPPSGCCH